VCCIHFAKIRFPTEWVFLKTHPPDGTVRRHMDKIKWDAGGFGPHRFRVGRKPHLYTGRSCGPH